MGMKKEQVVRILTEAGIVFNENDNYGKLLALVRSLPGAPIVEDEPEEKTEEVKKPVQIKFVSKIPKRNQFLADKHRDERDAEVLRAEASKRDYRGKLKTITTIKHMNVNAEGNFVTEFILDLKE